MQTKWAPCGCILAILLLACAVNPAEAQWLSPQRVNDAGDVKAENPRVVAAKNGGFHIVYMAGTLRYKRYKNGGLQPVKVLFTPMNFNPELAESLSGVVHVVYEDWSVDGAPEVGWVRSTDDGATFSAPVKISASGGKAKYPLIAPFGTGTSGEILMSYYRTDPIKQIWYSHFNGSAWQGEANTGSRSESEFDCFGIERSPADGSVWRGFSPSETVSKIRNYTGAWGPEVQMPGSGWVVRQHIAVNASGHVMIMWDDTVSIFSVLYRPGTGFDAVQNLGAAGYRGAIDVCAIPGTNDFYMVYGKGHNRVVGRRWLNGVWQAEELISTGLAQDLSLACYVAAEPDGRLMCVWEYWGSGNAQVWYAIKPPTPMITFSPASISRTVQITSNLPSDTFQITNAGSGTMNFTAADNATWLNVVNGSGTLGSSQSATVSLVYDVSTLTAGTYNASVTLAAPSAINSPQVLPVTVTVKSVKPDLDGDGDVDQSDFGLFQACLTGPNTPQIEQRCHPARLDTDLDVDGYDLETFKKCFQGVNVIPAANCAD